MEEYNIHNRTDLLPENWTHGALGIILTEGGRDEP
jgi:hypothetical protein